MPCESESAPAIRRLLPEHVQACRSIYRRAAIESDSADGYSARQRDVWASFAGDEGFFDFVLKDEGWGFFSENVLCAFCSHEHNGYIRSLYVAPEYQRTGLGSRLLDHSLSRLRDPERIWSIASIFSRNLFALFGFVLVEVEEKSYQGVTFSRYIMEKPNHES